MAVRNESVRLTLDDDGFSTGMVRAAAAAELLDGQLDSLNRRMRDIDINGSNNRGLQTFHTQLNQGGSSLNQYTGRLALFGQALATIGPAAVPIGAIAVPAVAALASSLGVAAIAGGTAILAFQGVGDALTTLNKARLEPTVENLEAARIAMGNLSPAAQEFVKQLRSMGDVGKELRFAGSQGIFPGLRRGFDDIADRAPEVERILFKVGKAAGDLFERGTESLAGDEWDEFFDMIEAEAGPALEGLGTAVGNTTHALAELWIAFTPTNRDFVDWLVDSSRAMDDWAKGLKDTQDFSDFIAYVREVGPQVGDAFRAIGRALLDIAEAAAPLGGPVLESIEAIAKAISFIADSDMGTPILTALAALTLFNRAMAVQSRIAATAWGANIRGANGMHAAFATMRRTALLGGAAVAALAVAQTDAGKSALTSNTAMLALAGTMIGGPWGAAIGAGVGATMDLAAANDDLESAVNRARLSMEQGAGAEILTRDLQALNRELEKTEERLDFKKPSLFEAFNPLAGLDKNLHNVQATFGRVEGFFSDLGGKADETKASLEGALNPKVGGIDDLLLGPLGMTKAAMDNATASTEEFAASIQRLNNILSGRTSWIDYQQAIDDVTASIKENGRTLDRNTEKGRNNERALISQAQAALDIAATLKTADRVPFLSRARKDLVDAAAKFTGNRKEAQKLATALGLVPQKVKTDVKLTGAEAAAAKTKALQTALNKYGLTKAEASAALNDVASGRIKTVQGLIDKYGITKAQARALLDDQASGALKGIAGRLNALDGKTATTWVVTRHIQVGARAGTAANPTLNAFGGMYHNDVRTYAGGGMDRANSHQPEMSRPTLRIWAEPETGGESYIPWANDHRRPRAKNVLERTASMFGGQVQWFANGGDPDELEAYPAGPSGGKRMPPRLPGRQPVSVLVSGASGNSGRSPASRGFNIGSLGVAETREELREFARAIRESGKHLDKSFKHLSKRAVRLSRQYEKAEGRLERLRDRAADVRSAARGAFDNDPFGGSLEDFRTQLQADRNDANATTRALRKAGRKGLSGALAAELAASGNRGLAEQFAGSSRAEIARLERLFAQRERAQAGLGTAAVDVSGLSSSIKGQVREMRQLTKRLNNIERRIENAVRKGAREGTSGQKKERDRLVAVAAQGGRR